MPARYAYSLNGENYTGTFLAREEALAAALDDARTQLTPPQSVFVGRRCEPDPHVAGHARTLLREMAWQAHDEVGAPAAQYLNQVADEKIDQLDRDLEKVLLDWLRRHDLLPKFFNVDAITEHPVPMPSEAARNAEPRGSTEVSPSFGG
ncbi:MAG: hypothetical protein ACAI43_06985 [Phycisphaerae bacterium]|nr:hypothetical protein [Tepidisphaeraceae bacterium]